MRDLVGYIILAVIVGIIAYFRSRNLKSKGLIRNQGSDFAHSRFIYTLRSVSYQDIINALDRIDFAYLKFKNLSYGFDQTENCIMIHDDTKTFKWEARLACIGNNGAQCQYAFNFLNYPEAMPQGMQMFHTALEKMFLEFDWNTVVESTRLKTKTKTNKLSGLGYVGGGRIEVIE